MADPITETVPIENVVDHNIGDTLNDGTIVYLDFGIGEEPCTAEVCHTRDKDFCFSCSRSASCLAKAGKER